jgi:predicted deacetylase
MATVDAQLLVSLSGISPRTLHRCADLAAELDRRNVPLSVLYTPRIGDDAVTEWVRGRVAGADSVLLHGYDHRITPTHRPLSLGKKAEFASLPAHEARLRLIAATASMDNAGLRADGFAPPRWLASRGTLDALREHGFSLCADLNAVRDLRGGGVHRARVQEFGSQHQRTETVRCFAFVLAAARAARRGGLVRLGADSADLSRPGRRQALIDAVDVSLENRACGSTYAALTGAPAPRLATP